MGSDDGYVCGADTTTTDEPCQFPVSAPEETCPNHSDGAKQGRPAHEPTAFWRGLVEGMVIAGRTQAEIAERLDIAPNTLRKHYGEILEIGRVAADAQVFQTAFQMATSGNSAQMTQFWIMMIADWSPDDEDGDDEAQTIIVDNSIPALGDE